MRWLSSKDLSHQTGESRPNWVSVHGRSDVFDHGAVDFVRHVFQAVHHPLQVVQDFRRDPEVQRALRSLHLKEAAARGIVQVVCLALDPPYLFRQAANLGCVSADRTEERDCLLHDLGRPHDPIRHLDHLGLERFVLVGQSLGAVMATAFALQEPDRLEALVLTSPASGYATRPGAGLPPSVQSRLDDLTLLGPIGLAEARSHRLLTDKASDLAREIVRQAMSEITPEGYLQASLLLAGADLPTMIRSVTTPTTVIWGAEDVITPPAGCRHIADSLPGAAAIELPRGGHAVATEYPSLFNTALRQALSPAQSTSETSWT